METNTLAKKLLTFQKTVGAIAKDSTNPFFKSKYFDVNKIIEEVKPELSNAGLVLLQPLTNINGKPAIKTILQDSETGEKIEDVVILPENADPQKMGSIITYFRRYSLQSLLFLQAEDDDANLASVKPATNVPTQNTPFNSSDKVEGELCKSCGLGKYIKSKTTGKIYCSEKCWLNK